MELDGNGLIPAGTTIAGWLSSTSVTLSNTVKSGTGIEFALPGRNSSTTVLEGTQTTSIASYYEVSLSTPPSGPVTVTITPGDARVSLSSPDGRFVTDTQALGATAGVYHITFDATNYNIPVVIEVTAVNEMAPSDPHNTYIADVGGGRVGERVPGRHDADAARHPRARRQHRRRRGPGAEQQPGRSPSAATPRATCRGRARATRSA